MQLWRRYLGMPIHVGFSVLKLALFVASAIHALAWLHVGYFRGLAAQMDVDSLRSYVGFQGGFAPISSWTNFKLYLAAVCLGSLVILPLTIAADLRDKKAGSVRERLAFRLAAGQRIGAVASLAQAALLAFVIAIASGRLGAPLPLGIKWLLVGVFGISFGIDNLSFSDTGEKYGMTPLFGLTKAIEFLAKEQNVDVDSIRARIEAGS